MIAADELDRRFDDGEDVLDYFDVSRASRPGLIGWCAVWMCRPRSGVTRQALIKMWLADRLEAAG